MSPSAVVRTNYLMKSLKAVLEQGYDHVTAETMLEIVNQLNKEELSYVMARYVKCADLVEDGNTRLVKLGRSDKARKYLKLTSKEYDALAERTSRRIVDLHRKLIISKREESIRRKSDILENIVTHKKRRKRY